MAELPVREQDIFSWRAAPGRGHKVSTPDRHWAVRTHRRKPQHAISVLSPSKSAREGRETRSPVAGDSTQNRTAVQMAILELKVSVSTSLL